MKKLLFSLTAFLFASVLVLSAVRQPASADCAEENDLVASDLGADTEPNGHFEYTLLVESWELTFDPFVLNLDLASTGQANVDNVTFVPQNILLEDENEDCIYGPPDDPFEITVEGDLSNINQQGNVNAKILLTAGGTYSYDEPLPTYIPPAP